MAPKRKRARLAPPKAKTNDIIPEDYISWLPDDVLLMILSRLSIKEAGITSLLSTQWKDIWTKLSRLNFVDNLALDRIAGNPAIKVSERPRYISWVNSVITKHSQRVMLDTFTICFDLDNTSTSELDNWVKFAIQNEVKCLELNLLENGQSFRDTNSCYTISFDIPTELKPLKALVLKSVNVSETVLEAFLSTSPNLEYVSIHGSGGLKNLRISGLGTRLVCLKVVHCVGIESIEISNVNLVSFTYLGPGIELSISNVPKLTDVSVGVGYGGLATNVFTQLSTCLYRLNTLTLDVHHPFQEQDNTVHNFPFCLPNLKELILRLGAWDDVCLLAYASLINSCPSLDKLVMQLVWMAPKKMRRKVRESLGSPHECLKTVVIMGYFGRISDAEIGVYCIQKCVALERIIIDPRNQILRRTLNKREKMKKEEAARQHARKHLDHKIPPSVQLIIL